MPRPRQRGAAIPVYSCSGTNAIIRRIGRADAIEGVEAGDFAGIYSGRGQMEELVAVRVRELQRKRDQDPATITGSETRLNAFGAAFPKERIPEGRNSNGERIRQNYIDRVMSKVEAWPEAYDHNAVCIAAGRATQVREVAELSERYVVFAG
jgi:hypothetical protein